MHQFYDYFDANPNPPSSPVPGGIYWSYVPYVIDDPMIEQYHRGGQPPEALDLTSFDPQKRYPSPNDGTESDEFLTLMKFKMRPVVALSPPGANLETMQDRWRGGVHLLAIPLYSLWRKLTRRYDCDREFLRKLMRFDYASEFFLPGIKSHGLVPSMARLVYAQPLNVFWLRSLGHGVMLTREALGFLNEWFSYFLTGEVSDSFLNELQSYRAWFDGNGNVEFTSSYYPHGVFVD